MFLVGHRKRMREKCPNTEFFLVCIFPHLDWIRRDTPYLSVFSPNAGKYVPEKTLSAFEHFSRNMKWVNMNFTWYNLKHFLIS